MLIEYIKAALKLAKYEIIEEDNTIYAEVPDLPGVWANASTFEECREELKEVIEGWVLLGVKFGDPLPILDGIDLNQKIDKRFVKAG